jgi:hypothetical protein
MELPPLEVPATAELEAELSAQADVIAERLNEARERLIALTELAAMVEDQIAADERVLVQLEGLLGRAAQMPFESLDPRLRGERLREVALQILGQRDGGPVHYREWYRWLRDEGYAIAGKDPLASFLAQVSRAPQIERVGGGRSGRYQLRRS